MTKLAMLCCLKSNRRCTGARLSQHTERPHPLFCPL